MALTLAPIFFDERFRHLRTAEHEHLLARLGKFCAAKISSPDAGLWELRNGWQVHAFSDLMCWAGLDRIKRIHDLGFLQEISFDLKESLHAAEAAVRMSIKDGSLRNGPTDTTFDSALLQASILRFPDKDLVHRTVAQVKQELQMGAEEGVSSFLYRYKRSDDFGRPGSTFMICSFWLVQALAKIGQLDAAMSVMKDVMEAANSLGLYSEHYLPRERMQAGNFPQAYSHVGQINAAFAVSPSWGDLL
jgi:GH15 family glucan-1,4-alpha-glucosidase